MIRELYGVWVLDGGGFKLKVSYDKLPSSSKLYRMDPSPSRLVYPPLKIRRRFGEGSFVWVPDRSSTLRAVLFEGRASLEKNIGSARIRGSKLVLPCRAAGRGIVGIDRSAIVVIPNDLYGVEIRRRADWSEANIKPISSALKRRQYPEKTSLTCWRGFVKVTTAFGATLEREGYIIVPEGGL